MVVNTVKLPITVFSTVIAYYGTDRLDLVFPVFSNKFITLTVHYGYEYCGTSYRVVQNAFRNI